LSFILFGGIIGFTGAFFIVAVFEVFDLFIVQVLFVVDHLSSPGVWGYGHQSVVPYGSQVV